MYEVVGTVQHLLNVGGTEHSTLNNGVDGVEGVGVVKFERTGDEECCDVLCYRI